MRFSVALLLVYFLFYSPAIRWGLRAHRDLIEYSPLLFFALALIFVRVFQRGSGIGLGFSRAHWKQNLGLGGGLGGLLLLSLPLLDGLLEWSGLAENELFAGAEQRESPGKGGNGGAIAPALEILAGPILHQLFLNGLILQSLLRRYNPVLSVYGVGVLFSLVHFRLSLGWFVLGMVTAFLFRRTGTLIAPWVVHLCGSLAGFLLIHFYPRLVTLLGFLY